MISKINKKHLISFSYIICYLSFSVALVSCSNMLETESDMVEFEEDHTLDHATDSVYSVMGIINKMQIIADRVVLLGEVRGDLVQTTDAANTDLKALSAFDFNGKNRYNQISDYYAVINNCNYFIAHIDTAMERRGKNLFMDEYAVVKSYRAWTYLQLAQAYGKVPLILKPLMTAKEAIDAQNQPYVDIKTICETFIDDLTPLVGVNLPNFGNINGMDSKEFFIPMRALLGDLCLWADRYEDAARWYHDYLTDKYEPIEMTMSNQRVTWHSTQFVTPSDRYMPTSNREVICYIPMEPTVFSGNISQLENLFESTRDNNYFFELTSSSAMAKVSSDQIYCMEVETSNTGQKDTLYAPRTGFNRGELIGDLRYWSNYTLNSYGSKSDYSEYNSFNQYFSKISSTMIRLYRRTMIYLRYAEALNRAGYPQTAFAILKYGICDDILKNCVDTTEVKQAGDLIYFDPNIFKLNDSEGNRQIRGIHSLGSGDSECNQYYILPQPVTELATRQDTVKYQIPLVEDMIITEMALEGAFEGYRFNDLMRVALRRNDPAYLADPVSRRNGTVDAELREKLMNKENWYLPLR